MRILVIATQLPPYIGSGNVRALNYINYLSRLGHQVEVIGVDYPKDSVAYDNHLENAFDEQVKVYRIKPGYFYRFFYRRKAIKITKESSSNTSINSTLKGKINFLIKRNFVIPDAFMQWILPAYFFGKKLNVKNKYDLLFTLHETPSSHIVGYLLKRKFKRLRWVGYWSDPWNEDSLRGERSFIKKIIEEKLEQLVIRRIDKLLFTTKKTKKLYIKKYNLEKSKVSIVYRGYDKNLYKNIQKDTYSNMSGLKEDKINILHIGTIYHQLRDIRPLCNAIDILKINDVELYQKLNIVFIGQFDNIEDQKKLSSYDAVSILPLIPYQEALKYTVMANVLLLYGNKNSTQIPGKIYEYFGSKATILTLYGDRYDELKEIMEEVDKGPVIENKEMQIYFALKNLINEYSGNGVNSKWKEVNHQYEWENVVRDLEYKLLN